MYTQILVFELELYFDLWQDVMYWECSQEIPSRLSGGSLEIPRIISNYLIKIFHEFSVGSVDCSVFLANCLWKKKWNGQNRKAKRLDQSYVQLFLLRQKSKLYLIVHHSISTWHMWSCVPIRRHSMWILWICSDWRKGFTNSENVWDE